MVCGAGVNDNNIISNLVLRDQKGHRSSNIRSLMDENKNVVPELVDIIVETSGNRFVI